MEKAKLQNKAINGDQARPTASGKVRPGSKSGDAVASWCECYRLFRTSLVLVTCRETIVQVLSADWKVRPVTRMR